MVLNSLADVRTSADYELVMPEASVAELSEATLGRNPGQMTGTVTDLVAVLDVMSRLFSFAEGANPTEADPEPLSADGLHGRAAVLFGGNPRMQYDQYAHYVKVCAVMREIVNTYADLNLSDSAKTEILGEIDTLSIRVSASYNISINSVAWTSANYGTAISALTSGKLSELINCSSMGSMTDCQKVILTMLRLAAKDYLRKSDQIEEKDMNPMLLAPVFVTLKDEDGDDAEVYVHAYAPYLRTIDWIHDQFTVHPSLEIMATKRGDTVHRVAKTFKYHRGSQLPAIKRARYHWSFRNCVFDVDTCMAYYYLPVGEQHSSDELDHSYVSMHFVDKMFDYDTYMRQALGLDGVFDPMRIQTPVASRIMKDQNWTDEASKWFFILFFGRQLFPVNARDSWEVYVLIEGLGGTGKSTFMRLMLSYFDTNRIGILNSEGRGGFPLAHLYTKDFIACMECGDLDMRQNRFNSLITGEELSVELMYKDSITVKWNIQIAMTGNGPPPFPNAGDSAGRRTVDFRNQFHIKNSDPTIQKKLLDEAPAIMCKGAMAYKIATEKYGDVDLWRGFATRGKCSHKGQCPHMKDGRECPDTQLVLPMQLHDSRRHIQAVSNPIFNFLSSDAMEVGTGPEYTVKFQDFKRAFGEYCEDNDLRKKGYSTDDFTAKFERYGVVLVRPKGQTRRGNRTYAHRVDYLQGIRLAGQGGDEGGGSRNPQ